MTPDPAQTAVPRWSKSLACLVIAVSILATGRMAVGGPFDVFGFGARAIGMGGAATATADDYTATFYNPANLVIRKKIHLGAEVLASFPNLEIRSSDPDPAAVAVSADSFTGIGLGVLFPLGGKVDYRFAFGLVIYIPTNQLLRVDALDPLVPRWYLWDSLADKLQILFAVGGEITDWLRLGIGFQTLSDVRGTANVELELINETITQRELEVEIVNTVAPIAGFNLGPWEGVSIGFSWRSELDLTFDLPIRIDAGEAIDLYFRNAGQALYTPHTFSLGVGWVIGQSGWTVSSDLRYMLWSGAPDPAFEFAVDVEGSLVDSFGMDDALDLLPGPTGLPQFSDTLTLHLGTEYWASEHVVGRLGYQFRPSPIPDQVGLTNYVDRDTHTLSLGLGLTYPDPFNLDDEAITLEATGALSIFPETETVKASDQDPIGNYTAGGTVFTLAVTLRHDF